MSLGSNTVQRRAVTIPAVLVTAVLLTVASPIWLVVAAAFDLVRLRRRLPTVRLLAFGWCWAWLETAGVAVAFALWLVGQSRNQRAHFALQRWWAQRLIGALRRTCGVSIEIDGVDSFDPGPVLVFVRHASLADSLTTAFVITSLAGLRPRFVLKRELLADPCLDVVGSRIPNHFLDREATDSAPELDALERLVTGLGPGECGVIFPEGTRSNPAKRERALAKIAERDPARAQVLGPLQHVLPPRPSGAAAMVRGAPHADVVIAWHVGFEGMDDFAGILRVLGRGMRPIHFSAWRIPAAEVARGGSFGAWLDDQWLRVDREVGEALAARDVRRT